MRALLAVGITTGLILLAVLLWQLIPILILIFAGMLLALFLRSIAGWLEVHTPFKGGVALSVVALILIMLLLGTGWALSPYVVAQVQALSEELPQALEALGRDVAAYPWGRFVLGQMPALDELGGERFNIWARLGGVVTTTLGFVVDVIVILFVGIYFAVNPGMYLRGLVSLAPPPRRRRVAEMIEETAQTLRWWLAIRLFAMLVLGLLTGLGLWLLGVPMALTLGLLTGVLAFVPFLGPLLALVPAILLALVEAPILSVYVLGLFVGLQIFESYVLIPGVARRRVNLPVALVLFAQVVMVLTVGVWGWIVATPLLVLVVTVIKLAYVDDILGESGGGISDRDRRDEG